MSANVIGHLRYWCRTEARRHGRPDLWADDLLSDVHWRLIRSGNPVQAIRPESTHEPGWYRKIIHDAAIDRVRRERIESVGQWREEAKRHQRVASELTPPHPSFAQCIWCLIHEKVVTPIQGAILYLRFESCLDFKTIRCQYANSFSEVALRHHYSRALRSIRFHLKSGRVGTEVLSSLGTKTGATWVES